MLGNAHQARLAMLTHAAARDNRLDKTEKKKLI
jgi:hypothetical protein